MNKQIFFSQQVIDILEKISGSSNVARKLLDLKDDPNSHEMFESPVNYIDISADDKTQMSYINEERVELLRTYMGIRREITSRQVGTLPSEIVIPFDSFDQEEFDKVLWTSNRRFRARPTVVVSKILRSITGRDLEIFSNLWKSALNLNSFSFQVVSGKDIKFWYDGNKISRNSGSLGNSCMKYDHCQEFLKIYSDHTESISMLLMLDINSKLMGRALLWNIDGFKVMDRIYTTNDAELQFHFKNWAQQNDYAFKAEQKWNNSLEFIVSGKRQSLRLQLKLNNSHYSLYPYLDTFKFLDTKNSILSNYKTENTDRILMRPDGRYESKDALQEDFLTGHYHSINEMAQILYNSEDGSMRSEPLFTQESNAVYSGINEMSILRIDAYHDELLGDFYFDPRGHLAKLNNKSRILSIAKSSLTSQFHSLIFIMKKNNVDVIKNWKNIRQEWEENPSQFERIVEDFYSEVFN